MNQRRKLFLIMVAAIIAVIAMVSSCGKSGSKIVFTTGLSNDEVFKIDGSVCVLPEAMVYLTTVQNQYENTYGVEMWEQDFGGTTLEEYVKESVISQLAQIKSMAILAKDREISLSEEESALVAESAKEYFATLDEKEIEYLDVTEKIIAGMYADYALANKVYTELTEDVDTEVSDDEARIITVQHILIKNYGTDADGSRTELSQDEKQAAKAKAEEVLARAQAGEAFTMLAETYNEDSETEYTFGRGTMSETFEAAAFDMEDGELSGIVETEFGYHILKCIVSYDKEETDKNKLAIAQQRKTEAFNEIYNVFTAELPSEFNDKLWDGIEFESGDGIETTEFFDVYNSKFGA